MKLTSLDSESVQTDYGQFRRKGKAFHRVTGKLVSVRADIADTWFSIPATTATEHGYLSMNDEGELQFTPHTEQTETPAQFRKSLKKAYV
jgi:hypothetical protein